MNQSKTDLGIVNESQLLRFGITNEFVKCTLLIDHATEQLAFTACVFEDCNIDKLQPDEARGLYVRDNFFDRPLEERRAELENRLAQALAARKAKGK